MHTPSLIDMLRHLIGTPSVSAASPRWDMGNREIIDHLASWLDALGFSVRVIPLKHQANKANLVAVLNGQHLGVSENPAGGGLVLAGHTDTVPFDDSRWQSDPFTLTERDQRFYGLGSCDMKGFFALAIEAIKPMIEQGLLGGAKQNGPLIIIATADEESSMDGARELVAADVAGARYAIIGEPTGLKPIRAHKGMMMEAVTITGRSGHSSNPALGNSALEAMHEVMTALMQLRGELQTRYHHPGFVIPGPTMNFGCIHGGDNPNRICGECELHFDIRPVPGMEVGTIRQLVSQRLQPIAERRSINIGLRELMPGIPPYEQAQDSELVRIVEELCGHPSATVGFATEASFLKNLGLQTLVLGPGHIDQAHQPDEYLGMDQIAPTTSLLRSMIQRCCIATGQ